MSAETELDESGAIVRPTVESDAELADDGSVGTDHTPVQSSTRGPPGGALPTVREEMTETTRDQPPQLAPLASDLGTRDQPPQLAPLASEQAQAQGGETHWPLQGSPSPGETASLSSDAQHYSMAAETQAPVDKGKGKEVARD